MVVESVALCGCVAVRGCLQGVVVCVASIACSFSSLLWLVVFSCFSRLVCSSPCILFFPPAGAGFFFFFPHRSSPPFPAYNHRPVRDP